MMKWSKHLLPLGSVVRHKNEFIKISDEHVYKRCRVQVNAKGVVLRDEIDGARIKTKKQQLCKTNDLLVAEIDAKEGGYGLVSNELEDAIVSSHYFLYEINADKLLPEFLGYYLKTHQFREQVKARGSTNYAAIRPNDVLRYVVPVPPIEEQYQTLEAINSLVQNIENAKSLRGQIDRDLENLVVAMSQRNDLDEEAKKRLGWELVELGEVISIYSDPVAVVPGEEYRHFGIYSFAKGLFTKPNLIGEEIKAAKLFRAKKDLFIYGRLNAYEGAFAVVDDDCDGGHVSNEFPMFECDLTRVHPEFLLAYFSSPNVWEAMKRKVTGIGGGAGNRRIRLKEKVLLSEKVWLPPIEYQVRIKKTAEAIKASTPGRQDANVHLEALLPSILDKAFKGELV